MTSFSYSKKDWLSRESFYWEMITRITMHNYHFKRDLLEVGMGGVGRRMEGIVKEVEVVELGPGGMN